MSLADEITAKILTNIGRYKDRANPRSIICFAGVPGSGKTYLAERLEDDLRAIRISNDEIRTAIEQAGEVDRNTRERIKEAVIRRLNREVVKWPNGLIILDSDISRRFAKVLPRFPGYKFIIVSIDAPRDLLVKRIKSREGHRADPQRTVELLDKWLEDKKSFEKQYEDYISIRLDAQRGVVYEDLLKRIMLEVKS